MPAGSREELFAAWRLPFERLAEQGPTVLVFEDVQWADQGLLDFIEALLDNARSLPIFVVTLARPELFDFRPGWGSGVRSASTMQLEPLPADEVAAMIRGLVPRIPQDALAAMISRSEGIPLYTVETLRMLIDLGQLRRTMDGEHWELTGKLHDLAVPETLQALIASRLDALEPEDRTLLQQAAVLGQSFTLPALAGVSGDGEQAVSERLAALVRRDLLLHETNPRSPERGQYQFVQGIVREVAHGLLSRADRRALHLAAARHFESLGDEELAGILASHYMAAHAATTPGPEADALAAQARIALRAAADRSIELHAWDAAIKHLEQAIEITTDPAELAALEERAAQAAIPPNRYDVAVEHANAAVARHRATGDRLGELRGQALRADVEMSQHGDRTAIPILRDALQAAADLAPSVEHARAEAQLARALMLQGSGSESIAAADRVLASPAVVDHADLVLETLITKGAALQMAGRFAEADVVLHGAIDVGDRDANVNARLRARNNILGLATMADARQSMAIVAEGYEIARRLGARTWEDQFGALLLSHAFEMGDVDAWADEVGDRLAEAPSFYRGWRLFEIANRRALRGSIDEARSLMAEAAALLSSSSQASDSAAGTAGLIDFLAGEYPGAIERFEPTWRGEQGYWTIRWGIAAALMQADVRVLREIGAVLPEAQLAGKTLMATAAATSAGLLALGEPALDRPDLPQDLRGSVIAALALADETGLLLWRAVIATALGALLAGRFPEADTAADEGVQFLRERGAGALADRLRQEATSLRVASAGAARRSVVADAGAGRSAGAGALE
jgi:tetratricopeptide (TPR) repeat protein